MKKQHAQIIFNNRPVNSLSIEVTTRCNSACLHCFVHAGIPRQSSLSLELAREIVKEGYIAEYRHLHITGGEPLLWNGLFELFDYAFNLGFETILLNTNGTMLTKELNDRLASYKGLSISISLDGPQAIHDRIRGKGSYKRVIECIESALNARIAISIYTTVRRSLIPHLVNFAEDTYKRFADLNCLTLIQLIQVSKDTFNLSDELLEPEHFLQMVWMVSLLNLCGFKTYILRNPLTEIAAKLLKVPCMPRTYPLYNNGSMFIMANRSIALAHSLRSSLGVYKPGMIRKILSSDAYREATTPDSRICGNCRFYELCRSYGMLRPTGSTLDQFHEVPYCQRVLQQAKCGFQNWIKHNQKTNLIERNAAEKKDINSYLYKVSQ